MLKATKEIYSENILEEIAGRYKLPKTEFKLLDGFESFIYEFQQNNRSHILRVTHSLHRNVEQIKAEVDWVNYLADNGVAVSRAVHSPEGNLVEKVDLQDSYFMAIAFEKAQGRHVQRDDISKDLFASLGQLIGKMHHLTKEYQPSDPGCMRPDWDVEIAELHDHIPEAQQIVSTKFYTIIDYLNKLQKDKDSFGLIHTDAHFGNMFIDKGKLTLFDFDDSAYKWFISDIAIVLFYGVMREPENLNRKEYGEFIFKNFMHGYCKENIIDPYWFELMPDFLKLREIVLYAVVHMGFDVDNLQDPWCKWYLDGRREKIEQNVPYLDLNYKKLSKL